MEKKLGQWYTIGIADRGTYVGQSEVSLFL